MQSWFKSYLTNWKQFVPIKNLSSSMSNITLGVPQGLVFGPILFILYISDMHRSSNQMRFVHLQMIDQFCIWKMTLTMFMSQ